MEDYRHFIANQFIKLFLPQYARHDHEKYNVRCVHFEPDISFDKTRIPTCSVEFTILPDSDSVEELRRENDELKEKISNLQRSFSEILK